MFDMSLEFPSYIRTPPERQRAFLHCKEELEAWRRAVVYHDSLRKKSGKPDTTKKLLNRALLEQAYDALLLAWTDSFQREAVA